MSDTKTLTQLTSVQAELSIATMQIKREREAREVYAKMAQVSQTKLSELDTKIDELSEYAANLEDVNRECLAPADTERLRNLWK